MTGFTASSSKPQLLPTAQAFACLDAGVIAAISLTESRQLLRHFCRHESLHPENGLNRQIIMDKTCHLT